MVEMNTWGVVGTIVIVLLVIGVVTYGFTRGASNTFQFVGQEQLKQKNKLCEVSGRQILDNGELKELMEGAKGDGFPDDCDICLGGDNNIVSNSYGIPDACYINPATNKNIKSYRDICKAKTGCYISDTDQCCIGDAKSKCGSSCK